MKIINTLCICVLLSMLIACGSTKTEKANQPEDSANPYANYQAISLLGDTLRSAAPSEAALRKLDSVKTIYDNEQNLDNLIWYGRFTAYAGDYRGSIDIYTKGLQAYPDEPWLYRHRGHRYISVREFDKAIEDLEYATQLVQGMDDIVEPDGSPNPAGIPIGTLVSNIDYHLGLAYYLKNDYENSARVYGKALQEADNPDKITSSAHWYYMSNKLLGNDTEAQQAVSSITADMDIIENFDYHKICLVYNGTTPVEELTIDPDRGAAGDALAYGIGNYYFYNGDTTKAKAIFETLIDGEVWASFGHIAAESHYAWAFDE